MIQKIDDLKHPPVIGDIYMVPCLVIQENTISDWEVQLDGELIDTNDNKLHLYPVINHPHSDMENGQKEPHYHRDFRFSPISARHYLNNSTMSVRIYLKIDDAFKNKKLEYFAMTCVSLQQGVITPPFMIRNSKLKHKCIHKGKCPHRGYDLSQEVPRDGKITCPLHGLQFDSITKALMNDPMLTHILEQIKDTRDLIESEDDWVNEHRGNTGILRNRLQKYEKQLHDKYPDEYAKYVQRRAKIVEQAKLRLSVYTEMQNKAALEPTTHTK